MWARLGLLLLMLLTGAVAQAESEKDHDRARQLREAGVIVAVEPLIAEAKRRLPGRLLEIEFEDKGDGEYVYEIELVDNKGVVREFFFDAKTGRFLKEGIHWGAQSGEAEGKRR
ncbi:MAG: PepSY domain-containing protein [Gammaproteobacteria bacterium]|nr:PepSY domain-containing protein [Gammaproteobacteria bacterium]